MRLHGAAWNAGGAHQAGHGPAHKYPSDMQNRRAEAALRRFGFFKKIIVMIHCLNQLLQCVGYAVVVDISSDKVGLRLDVIVGIAHGYA